MMTKNISVADEVYEYLASKARGFESPNDVLVRELGLSGDEPSTEPSGSPGSNGRTGGLWALVEAGLVHAGDELVHERKARGQRFTARVDELGWVVTDGGRHRMPSPALGEYVGTQISGWAFWTHERSGQTLYQLRGQLSK